MDEEIKSLEFIVCNGLKNVITTGGNPPTIEPGMHVTLCYKEYLVVVKVDPKISGQKTIDFLGRVISVNLTTEGFSDICVNDWIRFKREHVLSIGQQF